MSARESELLIPPQQFEERLASMPPEDREAVAQFAARAIRETPFLQTEAGRVRAWQLALSEADRLKPKPERLGSPNAKVESQAPPPDPDRFVRVSVGGWDLLQRELHEPPSLIGNGILCEADLAFLFGENGAGKSQLAIQLAVARALGIPWLGFNVALGRTGLLMMELDASAWQKRIRAFAGDLAGEALDSIRVVCRPMLRGVVSLNTDAHMAELRRWIEVEKLTLAVLDPLFRLHSVDENDAGEMGSLVQKLDALRVDTGCAPLIPHHTRKGQAGGKDSLRDSARGSGVLTDAPSFYCRIQKRGDMLRVLQFGKTSRTAEPPDVWLAKDPESGILSVAESPKALADANRDRVLKALWKLGADGAKRKAIVREVGLGDSTVKGHLAALEAEGKARNAGNTRASLWWPVGDGPHGEEVGQ